ncbi:hypothetical protein [Labrenzia sp. 011]|uniref:hypothetical protein n=1 Tax=Labrenzia sp. 011 TaxID=2171494 RepID=UPI000D5086AC|nr:hypothetical protein [Labrenzia sp. 011]PVB62235.1 hypothetical protein DCO57_07995 [Labrenzia sp. 011]
MTHLTEDSALALAQAALEEEATPENLVLVSLEPAASGPVWIFQTATIGSQWEVRIEDRTGSVLGVKRLGFR